ncbi:MAG: hypothetical protein CMJ31_10270 [Phycisphaerae bacterium]|nr:hypothetical protein [Phycisphaerae bacterium]
MLATAAVVGAGPSGQAISILLAQAGVDVTVFERAPAIEPVGAGLLVQPTGERVLRELGVAERLIDLAAPIDRLYGDTDRGRRVLDVRYADLAPGLVGRGLLRSAIASALLDRMRATGVRLITGTPISTTRPCAGADEVIDDHGRVHGPFDLVVIADGARSSLRATALEDDAVRRVRR